MVDTIYKKPKVILARVREPDYLLLREMVNRGKAANFRYSIADAIHELIARKGKAKRTEAE